VTQEQGSGSGDLGSGCGLRGPKSKVQGLKSHSIFLLALGCPKNLVDSEKVLGAMSEAGYAITTSQPDAAVIVVTTCAFLGSAVKESEDAIRRALAGRRPGQRVVVCGCLVERFGARLRRRLPGVDLFVRIADMPRLPALLAASGSRSAPQSAICHLPSAISYPLRLLSTPRHYAYLKIADGCDNRCAYCLIPSIRGPLRSRPIADIAAEARGLARLGVKELILVAQDTTAYGKDIYARPALQRLLRNLSAIRGVRWLRLMYTHPAHVTRGLLAEFESNPKLCRYIDLPVQHVSSRLLAAMNRPYTHDYLDRLLDRLRSIPGMHIRTTLIVGFPGETEAEFSELLDFVHKARFDRLGAYAYSAEPRTRAARLPGQLPEAVKQRRLARLMQLQARISREKLNSLVGRRVRVLADTSRAGRTEWDAPEIDGVVRLTRPVTPGTFVSCRVLRSTTHDLVAEPLSL
jgi:ribosomal protein S12 methylthiotransferase